MDETSASSPSPSIDPLPPSPRSEPPKWTRLRTISRIARLVYVCRVTVLCGVLIALLGWKVEQIHEIVRVYVVDTDSDGHRLQSWSNLVVCYVFLALLSFQLVGWSRFALVHRFPAALAHNRLLRAALNQFPIVVALLPWVGALLAVLGSRQGLAPDLRSKADLLLLAVVLLAAVSVVAARGSPERKSDDRAALERFLFWWSLALSASFFATAVSDPWWLGRWVGTIGILLAAALSVVPVLSWLTSAPRSPRWHWLSAIAGVALLFGAFDLNDNHPVRPLSQQELETGQTRVGTAPAPPQAAELSIQQAFELWLKARPSETPGQAVPVILVAAEGGGIRAAYFTALVLATLQDRCPAFARHVFAISGVSGGSVGAAVFHALVTDAVASRRKDASAPKLSDCPLGKDKGPQESKASSTYAQAVEDVLREDLLAPLTASLLFPEAAQRLAFWPIDSWDRAVTLERTLEQAYAGARHTSTLERSLYRTWRPESDAPMLLMNATRVDTGERVISAPVLLTDERFHGVLTLADLAPFTDVRISTAAFLSARFPYVTPAAYLGGGDSKLRLVDGGYFENSGSATLEEMLTFVTFWSKRVGRKVQPIVIQIGNSPLTTEASGQPPPTALGELLSPVRAMVATREARGQLAAAALKSRVTGMLDEHVCAEHIEFRINAGDVVLPLGWQLAQATRQALRQEFERSPACDTRAGVVNACSVEDVMRALNQAYLCDVPAQASDQCPPMPGSNQR